MKNLLKLLLAVPGFLSAGLSVGCYELTDQILDNITSDLVENESKRKLDATSKRLKSKPIDSKGRKVNYIKDAVDLVQTKVNIDFLVKLRTSNEFEPIITNAIKINVFLYDTKSGYSSDDLAIFIIGIENDFNTNPIVDPPTPPGGGESKPPIELVDLDKLVFDTFPNLLVGDSNWTHDNTTLIEVIDKIQAALGSQVTVMPTEGLQIVPTSDYVSLGVIVTDVNNAKNQKAYDFKIDMVPGLDWFLDRLKLDFDVTDNSTPQNMTVMLDGTDYDIDSTTLQDIVDDIQPAVADHFNITTSSPSFVLSNGEDIFNSTIKTDFMLSDGHGHNIVVHFIIEKVSLNLAKVSDYIEAEIQNDALDFFHIGQKEDIVANYIEANMVGNTITVTATSSGTLQPIGSKTTSIKTIAELKFRQRNNRSNSLIDTIEFVVL